MNQKIVYEVYHGPNRVGITSAVSEAKAIQNIWFRVFKEGNPRKYTSVRPESLHAIKASTYERI